MFALLFLVVGTSCHDDIIVMTAIQALATCIVGHVMPTKHWNLIELNG